MPMNMNPADVISGIGIVVKLAEIVAEQLGQTTAEVLAAAAADVAAKAEDPSDETDAVSDAIDANLPRIAPPFEPGDADERAARRVAVLPELIEAEANELIRRRARQQRDDEIRRLWRFEETTMRWIDQHRHEPGCTEHVDELIAARKLAVPDPSDPPPGSGDQ